MDDAVGMIPPQQLSPQHDSRVPPQYLRPPSSATTGRSSAMGYGPPGTSEQSRMSAGSVASIRQPYQQRPPSSAQSHLSSNPTTTLRPGSALGGGGDLDRYPSFGGVQNQTRDTSPYIPQLPNGKINGSSPLHSNFHHMASPLGISADFGPPGPNRATTSGQLPPPGSFDPHSRPGSRMTNGPPPSAMSRYSGSSQLSFQSGPYPDSRPPLNFPTKTQSSSQQGPYPNVARSTAVELELPPHILRQQQQKQGKPKTAAKARNLFKWKKGKAGSGGGGSDDDYEEDGADIDDYSFAPSLMGPEPGQFDHTPPVMSRQFNPGQGGGPQLMHPQMMQQQQQQQQQRSPFQQPMPYSMPPPNQQFAPHHFQQQQHPLRPLSQQPQQQQQQQQQQYFKQQQPQPSLQQQQQQQQQQQSSHSSLENPVPVNTPPLSDSATTSLGNHSNAPSSRGSHHSQHAPQPTGDQTRPVGTDGNSIGNSHSSSSHTETDFKQLQEELAESINREAQLESLLQQARGEEHESPINPDEFTAQTDRVEELLRVIRSEAQEKARLRLEFFEKLQKPQMQKSREPKQEEKEFTAREEAIRKEASEDAAEQQKELLELTRQLNELSTELDACREERDGLKLETVPKLEKQLSSYDNDARVLQQLLEDKVRLQEELASERLNKDIHSKELVEGERSSSNKPTNLGGTSGSHSEDRIKGLEQQRASLSEALRKTVEMRQIEAKEHDMTIQRLKRKLHIAQARSLHGLIPRSVQHDAYVQKLEAEVKQYARLVSDLENKREHAMNYSMYLFDKTTKSHSTEVAAAPASSKSKLSSPKDLLLSKPGKAKNSNTHRPNPVQIRKEGDSGLPSASGSLSHSSSTSHSPETLYSPLDDVNLEPSHIKDIYQALDATFDRALSRIDTLETEREIMLSTTADSSGVVKTNYKEI